MKSNSETIHVYNAEEGKNETTFRCALCGKTEVLQNEDAKKFRHENFVMVAKDAQLSGVIA